MQIFSELAEDMKAEPVAAFGPVYPNLGAGVQKLRRRAAAAGSIAAMAREERQAYGAAVEQAIRSLQRQAMTRAYAAPSANCASGTFHSDGADIHEAVKARQRAEARAAALRDRTGRTPEQWQALYDEAMAAKHGAKSETLAA